MKIQKWFNDWLKEYEETEYFFKNSASSQVVFVRDYSDMIFELDRKSVEVVGVHTSKSVRLPVYKIEHPKVTLWLRGNFHNWAISVKSKVPLNINPYLLFDPNPNNYLKPIYFEGFEKSNSPVYSSYSESNKEFSVSISYSFHSLYCFLREVAIVVNK